MVRRHQLGSDRKRRRDGKPEANAGQEPQDDQLLGALRQGGLAA
jgi:hypothetical protein